MANLPCLTDIETTNKRVLVRVDFNVPLKDGLVADESRIVAHLPTIEWLLKNNARVILTSHLGRPDGKKDPRYSLRPVAQRLSNHLNQEVQFVEDCIGPDVEHAVGRLGAGEVLLLENLRFYAEEEAGEQALPKNLPNWLTFTSTMPSAPPTERTPALAACRNMCKCAP